jgi:hypothetical protein
VFAGIDRASHLEANLSGGLLKFWSGYPTIKRAETLQLAFGDRKKKQEKKMVEEKLIVRT